MSLLKRESNIFYVYAYLDNRKPGKHKYGEYEFDHEPFYIGKGHGDRDQRLDQKNILVRRIINKISKITNKKPIVTKLNSKLTESDAFDCEKTLIKLIGRIDLKTGTLANFTDGGEGASGYIPSAEVRRKNSIALKKYHKEDCNLEILAKRRKSQSKTMIKLHEDPNSIFNSQEFKEKHKLGNKRKWEESDSIFRTIEYKEKQSIAQKKAWANSKSNHYSEAKKQKVSIALKKIWNNPDSTYHSEEYRKNKNEKIKQAYQSQELRDRKSISSKKAWADPKSRLNSVEHRAKIIKNNLERWQDPNSGFNSPERRVKIIEANKKAWADPEHYINSKEYRKKLSNRTKHYWNDPNNKIHSEECRKKRNASIKKAWTNSETIKKGSEAHKKAWADPSSKYNSKQRGVKIANAKAMNWIVIRPDGTKIKIFNLSKFCRENNLNVAAMHRIAKHKPHNHQHKGWKCQYACEVL